MALFLFRLCKASQYCRAANVNNAGKIKIKSKQIVHEMVTGLKEFIGNPELSAHIHMHTYIYDIPDTCTYIHIRESFEICPKTVAEN